MAFRPIQKSMAEPKDPDNSFVFQIHKLFLSASEQKVLADKYRAGDSDMEIQEDAALNLHGLFSVLRAAGKVWKRTRKTGYHLENRGKRPVRMQRNTATRQKPSDWYGCFLADLRLIRLKCYNGCVFHANIFMLHKQFAGIALIAIASMVSLFACDCRHCPGVLRARAAAMPKYRIRLLNRRRLFRLRMRAVQAKRRLAPLGLLSFLIRVLSRLPALRSLQRLICFVVWHFDCRRSDDCRSWIPCVSSFARVSCAWGSGYIAICQKLLTTELKAQSTAGCHRMVQPESGTGEYAQESVVSVQ